MSVLDRKLFNRGGGVSSRGVGITSGLVDQPVQRFDNGGEVTFPSLMDQRLELLKNLDLPETFKVQGQETKRPSFFIPDSTNDIDVRSLLGILYSLSIFSVS